MANPAVASLSLIAGVSNGVALAQTPGGAGTLTLNGSLVAIGVATLDAARRVLVSSTGADSAVVFTIFGTNRYGVAISEQVTGVATATPQFTKQDFKTVTRVATSAGTAGSITVGTNNTGSSEWIVANIHIAPFSLGIGVSVGSVAVTYTVEHTYDDPNWQPIPSGTTNEEASNAPPLAWPDATLANKTTNGETAFTAPIYAYRLTITAGQGTATMQGIQAGIAN